MECNASAIADRDQSKKSVRNPNEKRMSVVWGRIMQPRPYMVAERIV